MEDQLVWKEEFNIGVEIIRDSFRSLTDFLH